MTLKKLAQVPGLSQNKKERLLSHGTAGLQMSPPHPTQQADKPGPGWGCNTLPAAEGRASPGLLLRCGAVCRETKPRKAQSCLVAWNVEMSLHTQWQICPKNDPRGFSTLYKVTMLYIYSGLWGETASWPPHSNLLLYCLAVCKQKDFKQQSPMQVIDFSVSQMSQMSQNISHVSHVTICTMYHNTPMFLPNPRLSPTARPESKFGSCPCLVAIPIACGSGQVVHAPGQQKTSQRPSKNIPGGTSAKIPTSVLLLISSCDPG